MSRKTRNKNNNNATPTTQKHFELKKIYPKTHTQEKVFEEYSKGKSLFLHGTPGSGKTFISLYLALEELIDGNSEYEQILIIRSVVPSRDMGFLPGTEKEKGAVYEEPYEIICDKIFGRGDGYKTLKTKKIINFTTTSFLRGLTFDNSIILVDEVQNMNAAELHTIMTRVGENSKIIFSGDFRQTDLTKSSDKKALHKFMDVLKSMDEISFLEFHPEDIVRSGLCRSYIMATLHSDFF